MATISSVRQLGRQLIVTYTDGTTEMCLQAPNGWWQGNRNSATTNPPTSPGGTGSDANATGKVTAAMVEAAVTSVGGSVANMSNTSQQIADSFNTAISTLEPGQFGSKARRACLVGECAQETDWYHTYSEYGGSSASYAPYYGRGFIQLTWRNNYQAFSDYLNGKNISNNVMGNLDSVATLPFAAYAAIYYFTQSSWNGNSLCQFCDTCGGPPDWSQISRAINRGSPYSTSAAYGEADRNTAINAVLAVTPDATTTSDAAGKAMAWGMAHLGQFFYTEDANLRASIWSTGAGDCSSFYVACFTQGAGMVNSQFGGVNGGTPGYTGTLGNTGTLVNNSGAEGDGPMAIGDAVLFSWDGGGWPWDHVAMYIGNNQILSHGGPNWNDKGPKVESLSANVNYAAQVQVRRYV